MLQRATVNSRQILEHFSNSVTDQGVESSSQVSLIETAMANNRVFNTECFDEVESRLTNLKSLSSLARTPVSAIELNSRITFAPERLDAKPSSESILEDCFDIHHALQIYARKSSIRLSRTTEDQRIIDTKLETINNLINHSRMTGTPRSIIINNIYQIKRQLNSLDLKFKERSIRGYTFASNLSDLFSQIDQFLKNPGAFISESRAIVQVSTSPISAAHTDTVNGDTTGRLLTVLSDSHSATTNPTPTITPTIARSTLSPQIQSSIDEIQMLVNSIHATDATREQYCIDCSPHYNPSNLGQKPYVDSAEVQRQQSKAFLKQAENYLAEAKEFKLRAERDVNAQDALTGVSVEIMCLNEINSLKVSVQQISQVVITHKDIMLTIKNAFIPTPPTPPAPLPVQVEPTYTEWRLTRGSRLA